MDLKELTKSVVEHPALRNRFYDTWLSRSFNINELRIFARNYREWVISFPKNLSILFANLDDSVAQTEIASTLHSEMGYGKPEKAHWKLLDSYLNSLSLKMGYDGEVERSKLEKELELLPSTKKLIEGEREIYGNNDRRIAVGAQLALEWQAYHMLSKLHEGAQKHHSPLWPGRVAFDKDAEYFLIHLIAEKDHERESLEAAAQYAKDNQDLRRIGSGYNQHLDLIANFWNGIYKEISGGN